MKKPALHWQILIGMALGVAFALLGGEDRQSGLPRAHRSGRHESLDLFDPLAKVVGAGRFHADNVRLRKPVGDRQCMSRHQTATADRAIEV